MMLVNRRQARTMAGHTQELKMVGDARRQGSSWSAKGLATMVRLSSPGTL